MADRELPLRIVETATGPAIKCLCDAESAILRLGVANSTMTGLRSSGRAMPAARADLTPAGVLRMILHAQRCVAGQNAALDRERVSR
jgi:hypothetical protein